MAGNDALHGNNGDDFVDAVNDDAGDLAAGGDGNDTCQVDKKNGVVVDDHTSCNTLIKI